MTSRGDTVLFQGVAVGFVVGWVLSMVLGFAPILQTALGPFMALSPHAGGLIAGCLWVYRVWKQGEAAARKARGLCVKCGYDLTGNLSGICPECGRTINITTTGPEDVPLIVEGPWRLESG